MVRKAGGPAVPIDDEPEYEEVADLETAVRPEVTGEWVAPADERKYHVSFALPYSVLVALLDPEHVDADIKEAIAYGLLRLFDERLSLLGHLVVNGFDKTAVRHKMLAAWREQHNRAVDGKK